MKYEVVWFKGDFCYTEVVGNMCCWQSANGEMHWCEHQLKCKHCGKVKK